MLRWILLGLCAHVCARNPVVYNAGLADPHIHVFEDRAYMYATHDYSYQNKDFRMDNWWIWSSLDLVEWRQESILWPEQTCIGKAFTECWATDAARLNDSYYFYFSIGGDQVGVVRSNTPTGPWHDPLGKPLLPRGLVNTTIRDPGVLQDDDGSYFIIFGVWTYYIAKLGDDLVSLAEVPRPVVVDHPFGPYGPGKLDDKPFLHHRAGVYYLSWGCFYATGASPYGPFTYQGAVVDKAHLAPSFVVEDILMDRHGSFFEKDGQSYYACNDRSHGGSPYFRSTVVGYVHYRANGTIAPVLIDEQGVGQYNAAGRIQAEAFSGAEHARKMEKTTGGFEVSVMSSGRLVYPRIANVTSRPLLHLQVSNGNSEASTITALEGKRVVGTCAVPPTGAWHVYRRVQCALEVPGPSLDLTLTFEGAREVARVDYLKVGHA